MKHEMRLQDDPFNKIKNGIKTVELRLFDVKRRALRVNDYIEFTNRETNEKIDVKITDIKKFNSFKELFDNYDNKSMGLSETDDYTIMEKYYTKEEEEKYGVVAIELEI